MHLDPRRLAVLRAVAQSGGILAAAAALHLTPSAVSQHIARLEAESGVTLLDRSQLGGRRSAGLTPAGRMLAKHAEKLSEVLVEAENELAAFTGQVSGPVTVGAFPTAIGHLVLPAATQVAASTPAVSVRIRQFEPEPGLAALRSGRLDLLITESDAAQPPRDLSGLHHLKLLDDPYRIVMPRQWGTITELDLLRARPWVDGPPGSAVRRVLDRLGSQHELVLERRHECLEFPAVLAIVSTGLAAAVVPALALPDHLDTVRAIMTPIVGARRLDLVHRHGRHEPAAAARVVAAAIAARAQDLADNVLTDPYRR